MILNGDEYRAWLATLKVGDMVCVKGSYWGRQTVYSFYKIERVTATQLISTSKPNAVGTTYPVRFKRADGYVIGERNRFTRIEQITPEVREQNERRKLEDWAGTIKPQTLTTECLKAMKEAFEKHQTVSTK